MHRGSQLVELLDARGSRQRGGDPWLGHRPGQGNGCERRTSLVRNRIEHVEHAPSAPFEIIDIALAARAFVQIVHVAIFPGEEAVGEAVEWKDAETVRERSIAQLALELFTFNQVVPGLQTA